MPRDYASWSRSLRYLRWNMYRRKYRNPSAANAPINNTTVSGLSGSAPPSIRAQSLTHARGTRDSGRHRRSVALWVSNVYDGGNAA